MDDPLASLTEEVVPGKQLPVLAHQGRDLFGFYPSIDTCSDHLSKANEILTSGNHDKGELFVILARLNAAATVLKHARRKLENPPARPLFTGQLLERLPAGVSHGCTHAFLADRNVIEYVDYQLEEVTELMLKIREDRGVGYCPLKRDDH